MDNHTIPVSVPNHLAPLRHRTSRRILAANTLLALGCCLAASPLSAQLFWRRKSPSASPAARSFAATATHPISGRPLLMGGTTAPGDEQGDTWQFDGSSWSRVTTATSPGIREAHAMANDMDRRVVVMFGGDRRSTSSGSTAVFRNDTWLFDGRDWRHVSAPGPAVRGFHAMAFSTELRSIIMFGGGRSWLGAPLGDTWRWLGDRWVLVQGAGPSARFSHAMAGDEARGSIIMFGGSTSASSYLGDTWEFRAGIWRRLHPRTNPAARRNHRMVYDPRRQRVTLMGGETANGMVADTWDWDGTNWVLQSNGGPSGRSGHGLATDRARNTVVLFGGAPRAGSRYNDTWELVSTVPHRVTLRGSGCTNGSAPPRIEALHVPLVGAPDFTIRISGAPPGARVIIGMSQSGDQRIEFPCVSYLHVPVAFFGEVADASGQAIVRVPIAWLVHGATVHCQGMVAVPNGAAGGFDYTQGLVAVVGD